MNQVRCASALVAGGLLVPAASVQGGVLAGTTFRLPPDVADGSGAAERAVPLGGGGAGAIHAGSTWNFQWWYRDPAGAAGFNLSQGLEVVFLP